MNEADERKLSHGVSKFGWKQKEVDCKFTDQKKQHEYNNIHYLVEELKAVKTVITCRNGLSLTIGKSKEVTAALEKDIPSNYQLWYLGTLFDFHNQDGSHNLNYGNLYCMNQLRHLCPIFPHEQADGIRGFHYQRLVITWDKK